MFALITAAQTQQTTKLDAVGYIAYGAGDFDGQNSGHDYLGTVSLPCPPRCEHARSRDAAAAAVAGPLARGSGATSHLDWLCALSACRFPAVLQVYFPSTGNTNNCDGGRSHTYCDYRQQ